MKFELMYPSGRFTPAGGDEPLNDRCLPYGFLEAALLKAKALLATGVASGRKVEVHEVDRQGRCHRVHFVSSEGLETVEV